MKGASEQIVPTVSKLTIAIWLNVINQRQHVATCCHSLQEYCSQPVRKSLYWNRWPNFASFSGIARSASVLGHPSNYPPGQNSPNVNPDTIRFQELEKSRKADKINPKTPGGRTLGEEISGVTKDQKYAEQKVSCSFFIIREDIGNVLLIDQ